LAIPGALQPIVAGGGGGLTLNQAVTSGLISAEQALSISGGLALVNPNINPAVLTISQIQGAFQQASPTLQAMRDGMLANQAATSDKAIDVTQSGASLAPVIGLNLRLSKRVNLAAKYEHRTPLEVTNKTEQDDVGMYPDGLVIANNLPSMLSLGGSFGLTDKLTLSTGVHYYFDRSASYGKIKEWTAPGQPVFYENKNIIDNNFIEAGLGLEYKLTRNFLVSAGYLRTQTGVNDLYQSDVSHSLSTNSLGGGFRIQLTDVIAINAGALYTQYLTYTKQFSNPGYNEKYDRNNLVFAFGLDLWF